MSSTGLPQALNKAQALELGNIVRLLQSGRARDAIEIGRRLVAEAAIAPDAHHLLALCHAENGDVEVAEAGFLRALELAPDNPMMLVNYAVMLRQAGRLDAALAVLRHATHTSPDFAKAWIEVGLTQLRSDHLQEARSALEHAVQLRPDAALAWHALGQVLRELGDLQAAEDAFERVIAIEPAHPTALMALGAVLRLSGRPDEAIACFDRVQKRGDASPELADAMVGAMIDEGRLDDALQRARETVRQHPDFVAGQVTLANLLWEYRQEAMSEEEPFAVFRGALEHAPDHHALRAAFIQLLMSARAPEEALAQIRIVRARADDPMLAFMQANALQMLGESEQAGLLYAQLHADWGRHLPAFLNSYVRHLLTAGKWDVAADVASQATLLEPNNQEAWAYLATAWRLLQDPREHWLCDYERLVQLVDIETPPEFASQEMFLDALAANLDKRHQAAREPIQQSLRGGSQTPGRLFGGRDPLLASARSALTRGVERWLATLPTDDTHPFLKRNAARIQIEGSWSVKLWSSGNHVNHIHPQGWISSAYYVALPPSMATSSASSQAGCIQFGQPPIELQLDLPPLRVIRPEAGKLAVFPSYFWHGTVPFEDEHPRVTMAFDMTPSGGPR